MLSILALLIGVAAGFIASRKLRRPQNAAAAASVARSVGATVGRRRGLTSPELQRACFSEMVRHVQVDAQGRSLAPNQYQLQLHPDDLAVVDETRSWFTKGLVQALRDAAQQNAWTIAGPVEIDYQADPARRRGAPGALAVDPTRGSAPAAPLSAGPTSTRPPRAPAAAQLVLHRLDTSERVRLDATTISIGRGTDQTIRIDDKRVSRAHAAIDRSRSGWTVTDSGSSNGTTLNDALLTPGAARPIGPDDVIRVGPVELRVEAATPAGAPDSGGTRALDERDRTRISDEVLPPDEPPRR